MYENYFNHYTVTNHNYTETLEAVICNYPKRYSKKLKKLKYKENTKTLPGVLKLIQSENSVLDPPSLKRKKKVEARLVMQEQIELLWLTY